jgi:hypothetical protein
MTVGHLPMQFWLNVVLFVWGLMWLPSVVKTARAAAERAATTDARARAVAKAVLFAIMLPLVYGLMLLSGLPVPPSLHWVFPVFHALVVLEVVLGVALAAVLLADLVVWLRGVPASIRSLYVRTPPKTN